MMNYELWAKGMGDEERRGGMVHSVGCNAGYIPDVYEMKMRNASITVKYRYRFPSQPDWCYKIPKSKRPMYELKNK
jgi:hypothetical protein